MQGKSDRQMDIIEVNPDKSKRSCKSWSSLEIGLSAIVVLLFIVVVSLIALHATRKDEACTTPECVKAAGRLIENIDTTVNPCENFYQYACGGWLKKKVIPERNHIYNIFSILQDELAIILKDVLEKPGDEGSTAIQKAKILYQSCLNQTAIESRGGEPLITVLHSLQDWPVATDNWENTNGKNWSLVDVLSTLIYKYDQKPIINIFVGTDVRNSTAYIVHIDQPYFGLPSRDYYNCTEYKEACEAYTMFMHNVVSLIRKDKGLIVDESEIKREMEMVMQLETELAIATSKIEDRIDPVQLYKKMNISEVMAKFPIYVRNNELFDWLGFINKIFVSVSLTLNVSEEVVVYSSEYLQNIKYILTKYSPREIQNYIMWNQAIELLESLSGAYRDTRKDFRKVLYGVALETERWKKCAHYVNLEMEKAVGRLYVEETFVGESVQMVEDLIELICNVFIQNLHEINWMDQETKAQAEMKMKAIRERIGYPKEIMENAILDEEYEDLLFSADEYFSNRLQLVESFQKRKLKSLRSQVDKEAWFSGAAVVNAFYSPTKNQFVLPAGILQPPFFSKSQPTAMNFGAIGTIIGHEVTHAFDNYGRNFDKDGNLLDWWTQQSAENFKNLSQCMVYKYGNFSWDMAGGRQLSGINTLGENVADNGGIRQAYQAYKLYAKKAGKDHLLPGINLNQDQLFFLNFAQEIPSQSMVFDQQHLYAALSGFSLNTVITWQMWIGTGSFLAKVWCEKYRPESATNFIKITQHSPGKFRVLGSLQNLEEFSKVFHCNENDYMNPKQKCSVW